MLRRVLFVIVLGALLDLPLWPAAVAGAKGPDQPDGAAAGLYLMEPQNGRTLLPLDGMTLATMPTGAITLGPASARPMLSVPSIAVSPNGSLFAMTTQRCVSCQLPMPLKYITIRIISRQGVVLHRFHPKANVPISAVADDGSRLSGLGTAKTVEGVVAAWYTLSGTTGRVLRVVPFPACCAGSVLYDPTHDRLYRSTITNDHHLRLVAYSAASGSQLAQLTLPDVLAGSWTTGQQAHGLPVIEIAFPGIAVSPDGTQLAVYDGQTEKLVTIAAPAMRIVRTQQVTHPQSLLARVAGMLGLAPTPAEAKGMAEGMMLTMQFSNDGHALYVTGQTYGPDSRGWPATKNIGLQRIDLASGQLSATALPGQNIRWLAEGADGQALYVLSPDQYGYCPCTLLRLDAATLQATAQRVMSSDWALQFFVLRPPPGQ
jgi:hypothetical protein